jgi:hypothetical protein
MKGRTMNKKPFISMLLTIMLLAIAVSAFALPKPKSAHYPRGGLLTLSPAKEKNNTYAFKPTGKADGKATFSINGAYAHNDGTLVMIQLFVVNKWGNWIAFGPPETLVVNSESSNHEVRFTIRQNKPFCFIVSSYGINGVCVIPYYVTTN